MRIAGDKTDLHNGWRTCITDAGYPVKCTVIKHMIINLELLIVAPSEELAKTGDTYISMSRNIDITFAPFIGLRLAVPSNLKQNDPRMERYQQLFKQVSNPTAIFEIEKVCYFIASETSEERVIVEAKEVYEPMIEQFQAYISFMEEFYGFTAL